MIMNKVKMNSVLCKHLVRNVAPIIFHRKAHHNVVDLKQIVYSKIQNEQKKVLDLRKKHGNKKIGDVTLNMVYGGMRGLLALVTETSLLDPEKGITFRGYTIPELKQKIPRARDGAEPLPEGMFWLLLTGDIPTFDQVDWLSVQWAKRAKLPDYVVELLETMPDTMHPMTQLSIAVAAMNTGSKFSQAYSKGVPKSQYWEHTYEDAMDLIGRITSVAAVIYKNTYKGGEPIGSVAENKDWGRNFAHMLGYPDPAVAEMLRLYLSLHCDHEGGNVSAHTTHLVGSALSDPYLAFSAGLNGLAGPLHGLANQEVLVYLNKMQKQLGENPAHDDIKKYLQDTLKTGQVIPGYGHAVLRRTDPRFLAQQEFCEKHFPNDKLFKLVKKIYEIAPPILKATGKVQNPYPNVDAHSGVLLQYYGIKEMNFYTVLFGVSRCLGVSACLIWDRALGLAIERPKSITTEKLISLIDTSHATSKGTDAEIAVIN